MNRPPLTDSVIRASTLPTVPRPANVRSGAPSVTAEYHGRAGGTAIGIDQLPAPSVTASSGVGSKPSLRRPAPPGPRRGAAAARACRRPDRSHDAAAADDRARQAPGDRERVAEDRPAGVRRRADRHDGRQRALLDRERARAGARQATRRRSGLAAVLGEALGRLDVEERPGCSSRASAPLRPIRAGTSVSLREAMSRRTNECVGCTPVRVSQIELADWLGDSKRFDSSPEDWRASTLTAPPRADSSRTWLAKRVRGGEPKVTCTMRVPRIDSPVVRPHEPRSSACWARSRTGA